MCTKNDVYAELVKLGVSKGYEVIPEFTVHIPPEQKKKSIDLVWAKRTKVNEASFQNSANLEYWTLHATFEIEARDVNKNNEFKRHLTDLPKVINFNNDVEIAHFVALYTEAYDRGKLIGKNHIKQISERREIANQYGIQVISLTEGGWVHQVEQHVA